MNERTVGEVRAELEKSKSAYAVLAGNAAQVGLIFAQSLVGLDATASLPVVHLALKDAEDLARSIRRVSKNIREGRVGNKIA